MKIWSWIYHEACLCKHSRRFKSLSRFFLQIFLHFPQWAALSWLVSPSLLCIQMLCVEIKVADTWFASLSSIPHSWGFCFGHHSWHSSPSFSLLLKSCTGKNNEDLNSPILLPICLASSCYQSGNTCFSNSIFADENFVQFHSLTSEYSQVMVNSIPLLKKEIIYKYG